MGHPISNVKRIVSIYKQTYMVWTLHTLLYLIIYKQILMLFTLYDLCFFFYLIAILFYILPFDIIW